MNCMDCMARVTTLTTSFCFQMHRSRIKAVMDELPEKATVVTVDDLRGASSRGVSAALRFSKTLFLRFVTFPSFHS